MVNYHVFGVMQVLFFSAFTAWAQRGYALVVGLGYNSGRRRETGLWLQYGLGTDGYEVWMKFGGGMLLHFFAVAGLEGRRGAAALFRTGDHKYQD